MTTTSSSTTSTSEATTSTTTAGPAPTVAGNVETTTTTIPTNVLGESFTKTPLAFTGEDTAGVVAFAGTLMSSGGLLMLVAARRRARPVTRAR